MANRKLTAALNKDKRVKEVFTKAEPLITKKTLPTRISKNAKAVIECVQQYRALKKKSLSKDEFREQVRLLFTRLYETFGVKPWNTYERTIADYILGEVKRLANITTVQAQQVSLFS